MPRPEFSEGGPYQFEGIPEPSEALPNTIMALQKLVADMEGAFWAVRTGQYPECHEEWLREGHEAARYARLLLDGCHPSWDFPIKD